MFSMQASGYTVVLNAQPQLTAFGIGQADQRLDQIGVGQLSAVAFELDGKGFAGR